MEKIDQEYDPLTGVLTRTGFVDNKLVIHKSADLSALVEHTNALRNDDEHWRKGVKKGWVKVASVSEVHQIELLRMGVDIYRASAREIIAGLKRLNAGYFITTNKRV